MAGCTVAGSRAQASAGQGSAGGRTRAARHGQRGGRGRGGAGGPAESGGAKFEFTQRTDGVFSGNRIVFEDNCLRIRIFIRIFIRMNLHSNQHPEVHSNQHPGAPPSSCSPVGIPFSPSVACWAVDGWSQQSGSGRLRPGAANPLHHSFSVAGRTVSRKTGKWSGAIPGDVILSVAALPHTRLIRKRCNLVRPPHTPPCNTCAWRRSKTNQKHHNWIRKKEVHL